jgi:hypothetical protein
LKEIIKKSDFLGPEPQLHTYEETRYKTIFGGIMSIVTSVVIACLCIYFVVETFKRGQSNVSYNEISEDNHFYNYSQSPFILLLGDISGAPIIDETVVTYEARILSINEKLEASNKLVKMVNCSPNVFKNSNNQTMYSSTPLLTYSKCIDPEDLKAFPNEIFGTYGKAPYSVYNLYINICVNNTSKVCKSKEEISQIMSNSFILLSYSDYFLDSRKSGPPGVNFINSMPFAVTPTLAKWFILKIRQISYSTDEGYVFQDFKQQNYTHLEPVYESVDNRIGMAYPGNFITVSIANSPVREYYMRTYLKFQDLLANIGGVLEGIILIAHFIEHFISNKLYLNHLAHDIFHYHEGGNLYFYFLFKKTLQAISQ